MADSPGTTGPAMSAKSIAAGARKDDPAAEGKIVVGKNGKSLGGSIGRAIVRGTLGGILRR